MNQIITIGETTKDIVKSFKRNDIRIRREISSKYGRRKKNRTANIRNLVSKDVVEEAREKRLAIVFEDIAGIRKLYRRGNGQGRDYRRVMNNHWCFGEIKRQVEYKASWIGVPVINLTATETRGTNSNCYQCGERFQDSREKLRSLWCKRCERWFDRDLVAVMNISYRGWLRFSQSKGLGNEAMVQERGLDTPILKVDPRKLGQERQKNSEIFVHQPKTERNHLN